MLKVLVDVQNEYHIRVVINKISILIMLMHWKSMQS